MHNFFEETCYNALFLLFRSFDECYVIIDEVDSMLLDKGNNVLYLSHECGGLDTIESLFLYIWKKINLSAIFFEKTLTIKDIKESVRREMDPTIDKEDLKLIDGNNYENIWNSLIDMKFIEKGGKILNYVNLHFSNNNLKQFERKVEYLLEYCFKAKRRVFIPNYLREFVDLHLENWITSAFRAIEMIEGDDYNLDIDRSCTRADSDVKIIIIDKDTGVDQNQSQWSEGLQQFLQLKHKCKITPISLKAIFLSNIKFFKMYKKIFGLTGTLGERIKRDSRRMRIPWETGEKIL
jgi:preprotein translocase subunit SecA